MASQTTKSAIVTLRLYRNLLRAAKPFTFSENATVLSCLLQRTGIDDHIKDWDKFISEPLTEDDTRDLINARDLSYSYVDRIQQRDNTGSSSTSHRTYQRLFRRLLREVVTGEHGYSKMVFPSQVDTTKLDKVIRREFRSGPDCVSTIFDTKTRIQVGFTALRELNKKLMYYENLCESAPDIIPQQAAWQVSPLPFSPPASYLRRGAFLVSHPLMNDSFFSKSVIIILDHTPIDILKSEENYDKDDDEEKENNDRVPDRTTQETTYPSQTYGLILNRVSIDHKTGKNRTLEDAFRENMLPTRMSSIFGDSTVREGGPVHSSLQMIHSLSSSSSSGQEEEEEDIATSIGGTIIPTITDDNQESSALYSDRATYFKGKLFKAMAAIEDGVLDRGKLVWCSSMTVSVSSCVIHHANLCIHYFCVAYR
jgi:putative AlgH/UPF0301 family transcriptional regulator